MRRRIPAPPMAIEPSARMALICEVFRRWAQMVLVKTKKVSDRMVPF